MSQTEYTDPWGIPIEGEEAGQPAPEPAPEPEPADAPPPTEDQPPTEEPRWRTPFSQVLAAAQSVFGSERRQVPTEEDLPSEPPAWMSESEAPNWWGDQASPAPAEPVAEEGQAVPEERTAESRDRWAGQWPAESEASSAPTGDAWAPTWAVPEQPDIAEPTAPTEEAPEEPPVSEQFDQARLAEPFGAIEEEEPPVFELPAWGTEGAPPEPELGEDVSTDLEVAIAELENRAVVTEEVAAEGRELGEPQPEPPAEEAEPPTFEETPLAEPWKPLVATPEMETAPEPDLASEQPPALFEEGAVAPVQAAGHQPVAWGAHWRSAAQGWVEDELGRAIWRPIITTAHSLADWAVDTYLGIVSGDASTPAGAGVDSLTGAREAAARQMLEEALARGAHAVIGVAATITPSGDSLIVSVTGTAVTLKTAG